MISRSKFDRAYSGLNSAGKKVYDAIPIAESWTIAQIIGELKRRGSQIDPRIVHGTLNRLIDLTLVRETAKGEYRREGVRVTEQTEQPEQTENENMKNALKNLHAAVTATGIAHAAGVPNKVQEMLGSQPLTNVADGSGVYLRDLDLLAAGGPACKVVIVEVGSVDRFKRLSLRSEAIREAATTISAELIDLSLELELHEEVNAGNIQRIKELEALVEAGGSKAVAEAERKLKDCERRLKDSEASRARLSEQLASAQADSAKLKQLQAAFTAMGLGAAVAA